MKLLQAALIASAILSCLCAPGTTAPRKRDINQINVASGLYGGGTGPKVTLGVLPEGLTGAHIQNGSLTVDDLSPTTREALRGPQGLQGPQGIQGIQGAVGPRAESTVYNLIETTAPTLRSTEQILEGLSKTFTVDRPTTLRLYGQITLSNSNRAVVLRVRLNGEMVASGLGQFSGRDTISVQRTLQLPAGEYAITTSFQNLDEDFGGSLVSSAQHGANYLDLELQ